MEWKNSPEKDKFKSTEESGWMHHIDRANTVRNLMTCLPARLSLAAYLQLPKALPVHNSPAMGPVCLGVQEVCAATTGSPCNQGRLQRGAGLVEAEESIQPSEHIISSAASRDLLDCQEPFPTGLFWVSFVCWLFLVCFCYFFKQVFQLKDHVCSAQSTSVVQSEATDQGHQFRGASYPTDTSLATCHGNH